MNIKLITLSAILILVFVYVATCSASARADAPSDPVIYQGWNYVGGNHYVSIEEFSYNNPCVDVVYRWSNLNQRWEGRWFKGAPLWFNNLRRMSVSNDLVYAVHCSGDLYPPFTFVPPQASPAPESSDTAEVAN